MKKTAIALAMATVLGVAGTAMAANPFTDVPANHWSYASVAKLAQAGIVEGYGDGTFQGNNTMTRYEMAQIVAKAMAKSDKADAAQKAMIEKLAAEYSAELNNLGVRVSALEKKTDNVKITGEVRISRQTLNQNLAAVTAANHGVVGLAPAADSFRLRSRITFTGAINDDWKYVGRYQDEQDMTGGNNDSTGAGSYNNGRMNMAYVQGPVAGATVTAGRQAYFSNYGLAFDSYIDGINVAFGNKLKANLSFGKLDNYNKTFGNTNAKMNVYGADLAYRSGVVNFKAGYHTIRDNESGAIKTNAAFLNDSAMNIWDAGFDYGFAKDFTLIGAYAKSNAKAVEGDDQDTTWKARINYKKADLAVPHSYTVYGEYRHQEAFGTWDPTGNMDYVYSFTATPTTTADYVNGGFKGYMVGGSYVLAKNVKFESEYYNGKSTWKNDDAKTKSFWNALYFYF